MGDRDSLREHFFKHDWKSGSPPAHVINACHWCQLRAFPTHKEYPVTIVNTTGDGAHLPKNFQFITQSMLTKGVEAAEASFRVGCSCANDSDCRYDGCSCLEDLEWDESDEASEENGSDSDGDDRKMPNNNSNNNNNTKQQTRQKHHKQQKQQRRRPKFAYHSSVSGRAGLLRSRYFATRDPIYECHSGCSCSAITCPNRVVERGRQIPLQIFRTANRGWGVRTLMDVPRGQFIDRYLGEILTGREANRRRQAASRQHRKDVYLFALDKFSDKDSLDPRLSGEPLEVDGEFLSGPTRFVNHSCEPNTGIFARVGDHADKHIHDLAFFALKDIEAGEELTFDYINLQEDENDGNRRHFDHREAQRAGLTRCLCGSAKCRGYLFTEA